MRKLWWKWLLRLLTVDQERVNDSERIYLEKGRTSCSEYDKASLVILKEETAKK